MTSPEDPIVKQVRAALEGEPRVDIHHHPVRVSVAAGAVVLEGTPDYVLGNESVVATYLGVGEDGAA